MGSLVGGSLVALVCRIAASNPNVRFVCLRRDVEQTVASWVKKLGASLEVCGSPLRSLDHARAVSSNLVINQ